MAYELYKTVKPFDKYFDDWDRENKDLSQELKQHIYDKYLLKCKVFQRDSFTCQNSQCVSAANGLEGDDAKLTLHHIRWRKDGGGNSHTNGVTLCKPCHDGYHRAKRALIFLDAKHLPNRLRGRTFKLKKVEKLDWKQIKFEMNKLRKTLKYEHGISLSVTQMNLLMKFLTIPYTEWDD